MIEWEVGGCGNYFGESGLVGGVGGVVVLRAPFSHVLFSVVEVVYIALSFVRQYYEICSCLIKGMVAGYASM